MKIRTLLKITAITVIALGCIHTCATPVIFGLFLENVKADPASLFMFVMVGISTVFIGWLQLFLINMPDHETGFVKEPYRKIFLSTIIFMSILGSGSVIAMPDNPFAYTSLLIAIVEVFLYSRFSN